MSLSGIVSWLSPPDNVMARRAQHLLALFTLWKIVRLLRRRGLFAAVRLLLEPIVAVARRVPLAKAILDKEVAKEVAGIEATMHGQGDSDALLELPQKGRSHSEILAQVAEFKAAEDFEAGKKWAGIYHDTSGDTALDRLQTSVWSSYSNTNSLYPAVFPSVRKFEAEIVAMVLNMLHGREAGREQAEGLLTSGGTESILIAILTYRESAKRQGIESPEIICCRTAHGALDKAAHYFGLKLVKLEPDENLQLNPEQVRKAITRNTVAVYASAPTFSHGVVDPIEAIAAITKASNVGLHVDNCFGGFYLSFLQRLGHFTGKFDFEVDGVTSISVDVHKYGYAPKGVSVVGFCNADLRRLSYSPVTNGLSLYVTPTLQGSRSGAVIAAAWATVISIGVDGYMEAAARLQKMHQRVVAEVEAIPQLRLLRKPSDLGIVAITSDTFDVFALASLLDAKGWNMFTARDPNCMGFCVGEQHVKTLDTWLDDMRACVAQLVANPDVKLTGDAAVYGAAKLLPESVLDQVMRSYIDVKMMVKPSSS